MLINHVIIILISTKIADRRGKSEGGRGEGVDKNILSSGNKID
jgi:hypothetical protein